MDHHAKTLFGNGCECYSETVVDLLELSSGEVAEDLPGFDVVWVKSL